MTEKKARARVGLIGVVLILAAVITIFSFGLYTLDKVLHVSIPYSDVTIMVLWTLIGLLSVWVLGRAIQATISQVTDQPGATSVRKIVTLLLVLAILFGALSKLGFDLSGYLVSLGITAVVIGFAAQTTIGNLISGMLVLISKPFRKGDYIRVSVVGTPTPIEGRIEEISFLRSRILTNDGVSISVPNTVMLTTPISNFTEVERRPIILNVSLDRNVSVEDFKTRVESGMNGNGDPKGEMRVYLKSVDQDAANLELWIPVTTRNFLKERSRIIHSMKEICEREDISLRKIELQS